jgi:hypothetical protein
MSLCQNLQFPNHPFPLHPSHLALEQKSQNAAQVGNESVAWNH